MKRYLRQSTPPVFWNFTPEKVQNPEKKNGEKNVVILAIAERQQSLQCAGAWPMLTECYSTLFSTPKGKRMSLDLTAKQQVLRPLQPLQQALQLLWGYCSLATGIAAEPEKQPIPISVISDHPHTWEETMGVKISSFNKGRNSYKEGEWGRIW